MNLDQYRELLNIHGSNQRDRIINKSQHDMNLLGPISPSYKDVLIDSVPRKVNIISSTITNQKIFHTVPGEDFTIGSIMEWSNSHWLITERDAEDEITVRGKIQICQKEIKWQDNTTGEIVARWATVEKPYYSNLKENNYITYSTREFRIQMPFDEYSSKLNIDKRLMLEIINGEPKTYRITSIDQMTGRIDYNNEQIGFLSFNIEQDLYNPETDNKELMICDYFNNSKNENYDINIKFSGSNTINVDGIGKYFYIESNLNNLDEAIWSIQTNPDTNKIYFENKEKVFIGEKCKIICENDTNIIGSKIMLKASIQNFNSEIELEVI